MRCSLLVGLSLVTGCSEYNLQGDANPQGIGSDDTDSAAQAGPQPDIAVDPLALDFGYLPMDCAADPQTVTVTNEGQADLQVSAIALEGDTDAFSLTSTPETLAPGASLTFDVGFAPNAWRDFTGTIRVTSNDPDEAEVAVDAAGVGAEDAIREELFEQGIPSKVDVLWIVDNSGSMSDKVERLQDSFDVFIESFVAMGLDYHIGVATTDMDDPAQSGRLVGSTKVIDTSTLDPVGAFLESTNLGSGGSGEEKGLDASYAALTAPLVTGANAGFVRADANLAVIILSDEDDQSRNTNPTAYAKWMEAYKGDPAKASLSAVVGAASTSMWDPGGCLDMASGASAGAGTLYVNTATATGGMWGDICQLSFATVLKYLSYTAAGLSTDFVLTETPSNIGRIVVEVDGTAVKYNGLDGWTWDTTKNAVHFNGDAIPGPGATVVVSYPTPTECN